MKTAFFFLLIFVIFFKTNSQIFNGRDADVGRLNFLVYLEASFYMHQKDRDLATWQCGGTIIHVNFVLTAAHCVADISRVKTLAYVKIKAGTKNRLDTPEGNADVQQRQVGKDHVRVRKSYKAQVLQHDVALLHIEEALDETPTVAVATLLQANEHFEIGAKCVITGWGETTTKITTKKKERIVEYSGNLPDIARQGEVELLDGSKCDRYMTEFSMNFNKNQQFCYGCKVGTTCPMTAAGDSGGPVVCTRRKNQDPLTAGIVFAVFSYGGPIKEMGKPSAPSVGTSVASKGFIEWKSKVFEQFNVEHPALTFRTRERKRRGNQQFNINSYVVAAATIVGFICIYFL